MKQYKVTISKNIGNEYEFEVDAESSELAKGIAIERYAAELVDPKNTSISEFIEVKEQE